MEKKAKLTYKVAEPRKKSDAGNPLIVLIHGRGADENDLLGLAPYLDERLLIVSVRAPFQFQWGPGYAWYDIEEVGKPDGEKFERSRNLIAETIDEIREKYNVVNGKTFLLGFSMGSVMSFAVSLSYPEKINGVVAHSGYIAEGENTGYRWKEAGHIDYFVLHGTDDRVISVDFGRRADQLLAEHGMKYTYKEYSFGHQIQGESLEDITEWIRERL